MQRNLYKVFTIALFSVLLFNSIACRSGIENEQNSDSATREFTDDLGKKINLPQDVKRVVSLAPNLTEIIFAVGAGEKLVGVTTFCNYPAKANEINKIGDTLKPNIENIIALKPDVVFVTTASQLESFSKTLDQQGTKVFVTNPKSLDSIYKSIETIGDILGKKENAANIVSEMKKRVETVENKTAKAEKITTFVQIDKSLYTIGQSAFLTDIVSKAGGISVTNDVPMDFPMLTKERAIKLNPQTIILSESPDNNEPNDAFKNSDAVKNNKIYKINADILSRPGPRIVDGLEQIAKSLHPELFE